MQSDVSTEIFTIKNKALYWHFNEVQNQHSDAKLQH